MAEELSRPPRIASFDDRDPDEPTLAEYVHEKVDSFLAEAFRELLSTGRDFGELRIRVHSPQYDDDDVPVLECSVTTEWDASTDALRRDPLPTRGS